MSPEQAEDLYHEGLTRELDGRGPLTPGCVIWRGGQMYMWDDDPLEDFGQLWISVCIWCRNGPLDDDGRMVCTDCAPRPDESAAGIQTAVARAAWISGGRMPF